MNPIWYKIERHWTWLLAGLAILVSIGCTVFYYQKGMTLAYGDAESHINISKRVISGYVSGFGQLGGNWLPLEHILMIPFVVNDWMWRSGVGGSVVSMVCYIISAIWVYQTIFLVTKDKVAGTVGYLIFLLNPNAMYMQSTPMGELPEIAAFLGAVHFFLKWAVKENDFGNLILCALFVLAGSLIRYDAWFMLGFVCGGIILVGMLNKVKYSEVESRLVLFTSVAALGVVFWILWNYLIFKNPLYFINSQYSAKSQQMGFMERGQLYTYKNLALSLTTYTLASVKNTGLIPLILALGGLVTITVKAFKNKAEAFLGIGGIMLLSPYLFYVVTLFLGISIIFVPEMTPESARLSLFGSKEALFNVRYGLMMLPAVAIFGGALFSMGKMATKIGGGVLLTAALIWMLMAGKPITLLDGTDGLSTRNPGPANVYIREHYNGGLIMFDDFSRTLNPVELGAPMQSIIYTGSHPVWDESLVTPSKYITWIGLRQNGNDVVWEALASNNDFLSNYKAVYRNADTYIYERRW